MIVKAALIIIKNIHLLDHQGSLEIFQSKAKEYPRHHTLTIGKQVKIAVD